MKAKYPPVVYEALSAAGLNNREIAKHLDVSEAAVRRGLAKSTFTPEHPFGKPPPRRFMVTVEEV